MVKKASISPRKMPKQHRSQVLVDSIIVATSRILGTLELTKSTTAKIAKLAGVSIGSLYQYFPNKESLVAAVIENEVNWHLKGIEQKLQELQDEKIQEVISILVRLVLESFAKRKKLTKHLSGPTLQLGQVEVLEVGRKKAGAMIEKLLESRKTEIQIQDYRLASYVIVSAVMGVVESILFDELTVEFEKQLVQETQTLILCYLCPVRNPGSVASQVEG